MEQRRVVDYLPIDISDPSEIVGPLRERRGGNLLNLDRILLHSPAFAAGWNSLFAILRGQNADLSVPMKYRELAICAIAILNDAEYEFHQHRDPWRSSGATLEQIDAIRLINSPDFQSTLFDAIELDVIQLTIEMTKDIKTSKDVMFRIKDYFGEAGLVEIVGTISGYNMVSRFLVALDITAEGEIPK